MMEEFLEFKPDVNKLLEEIYISLEPQYNQPSTNGLIKSAILRTARELLKINVMLDGNITLDNESFDALVKDLLEE